MNWGSTTDRLSLELLRKDKTERVVGVHDSKGRPGRGGGSHEHQNMNQSFPDLNPVVPTIGWKWIPCMDDAAISRLPRFRVWV